MYPLSKEKQEMLELRSKKINYFRGQLETKIDKLNILLCYQPDKINKEILKLLIDTCYIANGLTNFALKEQHKLLNDADKMQELEAYRLRYDFEKMMDQYTMREYIHPGELKEFREWKQNKCVI